MHSSTALRRSILLAAASTLAFTVATPAFGQAASYGEGPVATEQIVANHTVDPLGPGSLATGAAYANSPDVLEPANTINGVGQQIAFIQTSPTGAGLSLCSGTLINARTLITAAHCLYSRPAHLYGSNTGTGGGVNGNFGTGGALVTSQGVPLSFGFNSTNRCLGIAVNGCAVGQGAYEAWRDASFQTIASKYIYNANQVWYGTGAQPVSLGGGGEFANQDIALVTFDTHIQDIPIWTMLFSQLDGPTHATVTGYGGAGVGLSGIGSLAGIDYRRRSAENMIDALMTNNDWVNSPAINPGNTAFAAHQHPIYWLDFDDPDHDPDNLPANFFTNTAPPGGRNNGYYDFNGLMGDTLPNEGATAGGDSGGPLIVDQRWSIPVIAGVLTGSWSFNGGISTYGQFNVYPPLFQFWEDIVQNNPYKYVSSLAGDADWFNAAHWVQDMDPNYVVIGADGELVNALPSNAQGGADGAVDKYGTLCFLEADCTTFDGPGSASNYGGTSLQTAGGPGTTNFVPNNVEPVNSANAALHVKAKYYDVTLGAAGKTTLAGTATIDKLTVDGASARLSIANGGTLNVWGDFTQVIGWTNIDGTLKTSEAVVGTGLLSGKGTFNPTYLTVVGGVVAPGGGDSVGKLTVQGDVILASASALYIDAYRNNADQLDVTADAANDGHLNLGGSVVFNKVTDKAAPRDGESFVIAQAAGDLTGTFSGAYTFQGVLRPQLAYDYTLDTVTATLRAGSLVEIIDGGSATEIAFAAALDTLRSGYYNSLWDLYGSIDWMNGSQLAATFNAMTPRVIGDVEELHERQSKLLLTSVSDRLSLLASGRAEGLTLVGNVAAAMQAQADGVQSGKLGFGASHGGGSAFANLPGRMTGFIAGGVDRSASSYGDRNAFGSQGGWHMAMGLEMPLGSNGKFGTAAGIAEGESSPNGDSNRSRTTMAAAYAAMPLGDGFYVGGVVAAESSRASMDRTSTDGNAVLRLSGATNATRYSAVAEAGYEAGIGNGLTLTPRAQLGYSHYTLGGFTENGGETALKLDDVQVTRIEARLGAKLSGKTSIAGLAVIPQLSVDYVSLLSGAKTGATVRFAVAPDEAFHLPLATGSSGWAEIKGGVTFGDGPFTLGLSGQHAAGSAMTDNRAQADIRFRF